MTVSTNNHLVSFIQEKSAAGASLESIYQELLQRGHSVAEINKAIGLLETQEKHNVDQNSSQLVQKLPQTQIASPPETVQKNAISLILIIAAVLVGMGIFSFIASNWQAMGSVFKVVIILVALVSSYAGGFVLVEQKKLIKAGQAFMLLGSIIYGAGIFLIGQIFHIRANWPDGFILWMLGSLLFAHVSGVIAVFYLVGIIGVIASVAYPMVVTLFVQSRYYMASSIPLLVIATLMTFVSASHLRRKVADNA